MESEEARNSDRVPEPDTGTHRLVQVRFPWRLHILNGLILFLLCVIGPEWMRAQAGVESPWDAIFTAARIVLAGLLLCVSLGWHLALYYLLRRRVANRFVWTILFLLPGVLAGGTVLYASRPRPQLEAELQQRQQARALLRRARLAPLPESATDVRHYAWSSLFSGEDFLRFTADPDDIERFLADSPALKGKQPGTSPADRERLGGLDGQAPAWYGPKLEGAFRTYEVQPPRYQFPGELVVDGETNTVYLHLIFS